MNAAVILFGVFVVCLIIGVPVSVSLGTASLSAVLLGDLGASSTVIAQRIFGGLQSTSIMAIAFFVLAGNLMTKGGISRRIVKFANCLVGNVRGGMGLALVLACAFFAALSGSAPATVIAIGTMLYGDMVDLGYPGDRTAGLLVVSGGLGPIIPPSIIMVIYCTLTGASVSNMFSQGMMIGVTIMVVLMAEVLFFAKKENWPKQNIHYTGKEILKIFLDAVPALMTPVIILGGIYSGIFTATEAAVVASVYGIVIGLFVHRELKLEKLWAIFRDNAAFIAGTMFVMAPSKATGQVFAYLNITKIIANFMFSISTNPYIVLCMIFVIMFIVGMFVQTPAIVILAPTLLAVVSQVGIDPIHFGIIMTLALAIAFVTPPVALNLFVGSSMTGLSIDKIVRAFMPFLIGLIVAFFIVSFVPAISLGVLGDWSLTFG